MNTYNYQKMLCVWVSRRAIMQTLTAMHAHGTHRQATYWLFACLFIHCCCIPLTHPKTQLPQWVTVCSGGSETSRHVRMQIVKRDELGSIINCVKTSGGFEKPQLKTGFCLYRSPENFLSGWSWVGTKKRETSWLNTIY